MLYRRCNLIRAGTYVTTRSASLTCRDVFVLTANEELHDDVRDDAGNVTSVATGVILGLRAAGLPVCVLERRDRVDDVAGWESRVADVAVARTDRVTVAHYNSVHGMERRVVVWLAEWRNG